MLFQVLGDAARGLAAAVEQSAQVGRFLQNHGLLASFQGQSQRLNHTRQLAKGLVSNQLNAHACA